MEVSALRYSGGIGLHGRSPLLRLQSDERLISLVRRGNPAAFEVLVSRYQTRLLAFCRHLLGSREDAEDVLQEALAAAFNAILADDRPINVRPWLYRIARNRCLNHLRRIHAVGVDSMDVHLSEHGASTADKVHKLEEFRTLVGDIQQLPETQRTALVLREMDALSYEQIAEAMETTVPSVKSLLVRARVSLAEAAEARLLSCEEVRVELAEVAEGLRRKSGPLARRHLRSCKRCSLFQLQLRETNKALTALLPLGPFVLLRKLVVTHLGHSAGAGSGASGASAAGQAAALGSTAAGTTAVVGSAGGVISVGIGTIATKAAAGLAAAALVTAGAVEVSHVDRTRHHVSKRSANVVPLYHSVQSSVPLAAEQAPASPTPTHRIPARKAEPAHNPPHPPKPAPTGQLASNPVVKPVADPTKRQHLADRRKAPARSGRTQTQTDATVLPSPPAAGTTSTATDPTTTPTLPATTPTVPTTTTTTTQTPPPTTPAPGGPTTPAATGPATGSAGDPPSTGGASADPATGSPPPRA